MIDFERVQLLVGIIKALDEHGTAYRTLRNAAAKELAGIEAGAKDEDAPATKSASTEAKPARPSLRRTA